jgi:histidinol-phosphatase (PHP family)
MSEGSAVFDMRFSNMHQHSVFSDGTSTMEDVVQAAIRKNFVSLGFSDHSYTACDLTCCMMPEQYPAYFAELRRLKEKYAGQIELLTGLELDYFSEADRSQYDYLIGSVHYLIFGDRVYGVDHMREAQTSCIQLECGGNVYDFCKRYYDQMVRHITRSRPDIIGHFDVISKFGVIYEEDPVYQQIAVEALDECMKTTSLVEMNTGAISRGWRTKPYPHDFLLKRVLHNGGEIILTSDSHHADTIDCHFTESLDILQNAGYDHVVQLRADGFRRVPLGK